MGSNFLVYQAYGHIDILNEALISIASVSTFRSSPSEFQIVVYTDSKPYFQARLPFDVVYRETTKAIWEEWKGTNNFVHRAKIQMLTHFVKENRGNILYCDTDTYFLQSPLPLFDSISLGRLIMHMDEGTLENTQNLVFKKLKKFLRTYRYQGYPIPSTTHMWNAGVLGFNSSHWELLDKVASLSDALYEAYPKHVMEQLAFSYYFQQKELLPCEKSIFHYWDFKEYRRVLERFFEEQRDTSFDVWGKEIETILPMEMIKKKWAYQSKSSLARKWMKWTGKAPTF